jgi:hypothetical protein
MVPLSGGLSQLWARPFRLDKSLIQIDTGAKENCGRKSESLSWWDPAEVVLGNAGKPELPSRPGITSLFVKDVQVKPILTGLERARISATGAEESLAHIIRRYYLESEGSVLFKAVQYVPAGIASAGYLQWAHFRMRS